MMGTKGTKFKLIMLRGGLQPSVALSQAVTFYLSRADQGSAALMERVLVLESDPGVILVLPRPLSGLEQVQSPMSLSMRIT